MQRLRAEFGDPGHRSSLSPSELMLSLPDRLRPVYDGMLSAVGLCATLTGCLRGMVPTDARRALMLNDMLGTFLRSLHAWPELSSCVCGFRPQR